MAQNASTARTEVGIVADWLRQREGESDAAWVERLHATFDPRHPDQALDRAAAEKADRVGERLWKRLLAQRNADARRDI